jgi:hypothetical protein
VSLFQLLANATHCPQHGLHGFSANAYFQAVTTKAVVRAFVEVCGFEMTLNALAHYKIIYILGL